MFEDYFTAKHSMFSLSSESPLVAEGTNFQKRVWHHIRAVPYGSDITYHRLAELAGSPKGSRAVGMACGAN
jgi:methylated-DNA-[protein]-cysteine S-methyltransferase